MDWSWEFYSGIFALNQYTNKNKNKHILVGFSAFLFLQFCICPIVHGWFGSHLYNWDLPRFCLYSFFKSFSDTPPSSSSSPSSRYRALRPRCRLLSFILRLVLSLRMEARNFSSSFYNSIYCFIILHVQREKTFLRISRFLNK